LLDKAQRKVAYCRIYFQRPHRHPDSSSEDAAAREAAVLPLAKPSDPGRKV
jgi:hypothetical protein